MSIRKFHLALSLLFFFTLVLPFTSNATNTLASTLNKGGNVVGYLHINTPGNGPYRIYEADVYVSLAQPNPCDALPSAPNSTYKFGKTTKIDLVTTTDDITSSFVNAAISKATNGKLKNLPIPACLEIATFHKSGHRGKIMSNKVLIPATAPSSMLAAASGPFNLNLALH